MTQNYVFPSNYVQVITKHVYIHTIIPTGIDTCIVKCMMRVAAPTKTEEAERRWQKNYEVIRTVFNEDFEIGENTLFQFGRYGIGLHLGTKAIHDAPEGRLEA